MNELLLIDLTAWIGEKLLLLVLGLGLLTMLVMPAMRLSALAVGTARWLALAVPRLLRRRALAGEPSRPLQLGGLSGPLARLIRQTRTLALELRRSSDAAVDWPVEPAQPDPPRSGWRELLLGVADANAPLTAIRGDVFAWIGTVEAMSASDRQLLVGLGVEVEAVRRALTDEGAPVEIVRALAGLLWSIDERLATVGAFGYRGTSVVQAALPGTSARALTTGGDEDETRARRGRWAGTVAEHGPGLSQMAASYSRGAADRADLEQDIALALWRALPLFRGESSLKTFAYRVARYCCFRHVRRRKDFDASVDPASVADPAASIESAMLRADQRARIEQALTDLPDNLESVMTLHLSGQSYAQIAETLGITERNVSVRLSRARARLRRQLVAA
ncbi:sigma-70 family RNA polymerase sigma factor [Nannocystis bainbridge]|uniref:Sigma-70 family RNA polymerase sigma factor n=1 Tax=Nannocystis bainbridge TaxID=2995303 RepID=A0ABT5DVX0_9BACT|nr:sigma-70 family RNA polymerase sigma factor [Nannocystis bainbridge]MDC0716567.1 sigma-70 family RNA polymerase sigma factor [Nannocystis bainbridge]